MDGEKRNLGRNKNKGERKEKIKEKGKIEKEKIIKINTWRWRGLIKLFLNKIISHVCNLCLPHRQIPNGVDSKSKIENDFKIQGLNWMKLKH